MSLSNELHCHQNALKTKFTILLFVKKKKKNLVLAVLGLHCCVGFSLVAVSRGTLHCPVRASHCGGLSCCRAQAPGWPGFSSCSTVSAVAASGL